MPRLSSGFDDPLTGDSPPNSESQLTPDAVLKALSSGARTPLEVRTRKTRHRFLGAAVRLHPPLLPVAAPPPLLLHTAAAETT